MCSARTSAGSRSPETNRSGPLFGRTSGRPVVPTVPAVHGCQMDPSRGLGMPRIPGQAEFLSMLQQQAQALADLPRTLADLQGAVRQLTETTSRAQETVASAQR